MSEEYDDEPVLDRCLEELARLDQEQRMLDLRDTRAVAECQRRIAVLRQKIRALRVTNAQDRNTRHT